MVSAPSEANRRARRLFAPLAGTYDRYARLLSFGQDARWRRFLVARLDAQRPSAGDTVLDVATGTAAVAIAVARRFDCAVVGLDQSPEMLARGRARVEQAGLGGRIRLLEGRAEALPFADETFACLTFTYLLRYVDDPATVLRELARVVRPGGTVASLEFHVPPGVPARAAWELYTRAGLPLLGRAASPGWGEVGAFLGPSIRAYCSRYPLPRQLALWREAGLVDVSARLLSLGGGAIVWGRRGR